MYLRDLDENNIKMDSEKVGWKIVDRIDPAQNRGRWRAVVNTVMNFGIPRGLSRLVEELPAFQQGHFYVELGDREAGELYLCA
jgi:hypothetical protein